MPVYLTEWERLDPAKVRQAEQAAKELGTVYQPDGLDGTGGSPREAERGVYVTGVGEGLYTPNQVNPVAVHISIEESEDEFMMKAAKWAAVLSNKPLVIDPPAGPTDVTVLNLETRALHISHKDAQDTAKYRRARAIAEKNGQSLVIDPREPEKYVFPEEDVVRVEKGATAAVYRAAKKEAETYGRRLVVVPAK